MYVVTFYSYKGGVGRSMALVNIACALANQGKRVLVVDFDLEAPGITTYDAFSCAHTTPGIVDYVSEFLRTDVAPAVENYIRQCTIGGRNLWVMPAGDFSCPEYASRLNEINWADVYQDHSGFLMIEDLRQQWKQFDGKGFDYVLVDSRTGHTDVGGICTRQIPDAVVLMFFPNEQNISGLTYVTKEIREDAFRSTREVALHFCASDVPDLDDDENILAERLNSAKSRLGYTELSAVIHHYDSLDLIQQTIFTIDRPTTKLAKEYKSLLTEIISSNYEDRGGAIVALRRFPKQFDAAMERGQTRVVERLALSPAEIRAAHPRDPEIGWLLGQAFAKLRMKEEEVAALGVAIEGGYRVDTARLQRAAALMTLNDKGTATADLRQTILSNRASPFEILPAIEMLRANDPDWLSVVRASKTVKHLEPSIAFQLNRILMTERRGLELAVEICEGQLQEHGRDVFDGVILNQLILSRIGLGQYDRALVLLGSRDEVLQSGDVSAIYNYAIAEWGREGTPPAELMGRVVALRPAETTRQVNFYQCLALASAVSDDFDDALLYLVKARDILKDRGREFSTWRYLEVSPEQMRLDLNAMEQSVTARTVEKPSFIDEVRSLFP